MRKLVSKNKKGTTNRMGIIIFLIVCAVTVIFCFQYYRHLQGTIRDESRGYLQEVSIRTGNNLDTIIDSNYGALYTLAAMLENDGISNFEELKPVVQSQREYWEYQKLLFLDKEGRVYDLDGNQIFVELEDSLRESVLKGEKALSTTQQIENQECILFVVPLNNVAVEGKEMINVAAVYLPSTFDQVLSMSSFDGQAYSQIVSKSGSIVVRSSSPNAKNNGYNVFNSLEDAKFENDGDLEQMKSEIAQNMSGQVTYTKDGERRYMVYSNISPKDWYLITYVPADAVNARSDMMLQITLALCGLVAVVFVILIAFLMHSFISNKKRLEQIAYVDPVTGGNTIQRFYGLAQEILENQKGGEYALVYSNLSKFKVLNEQYGQSTCDDILAVFYKMINEHLMSEECMGRFSADNYCILIKNTGDTSIVDRFSKWYNSGEDYIREKKPAWPLPLTEFGIYVIVDPDLPMPQMIDRAKLALRETPRTLNNRLRYAFYDDNIRRILFREKQLEDMMEEAMENGEFQVFLQPKYRVDDEKIGGAEALVRWNSASEGMIYPDEFVSLFEKNGFIVQIDLWVFAEVCRHLREWIDMGRTPVKISVNCSRVHLKDPRFFNRYRAIAQKYKIPSGLLEIELTESVVLENQQLLTQIIDEIHEAGFECSMDDFGSGYSSLNLLQSINVDTLKIDKIFFKNSEKDSSRMESVVKSIVTMAQALSMVTVAEGVEYPDQVQMLKRIGCDYIQGYVFAKPMPIEQFEKLAFETK